MTTKRKIQILNEAKVIIKGCPIKGLCGVINDLLTPKEDEKYFTYNSLRFLGISEPKNRKKGSLYWYPLNSEGHSKRIKIIDKAIKKLECK